MWFVCSLVHGGSIVNILLALGLKEIPTHDWLVAHFSKKYTYKKAHIITVNLCKQTNETLTSIILALLAPSQHKKPTKPWAHDCMEKMKHIHPPYMVDNWFWILHHMWGCPWVKLKGFLDLTHPNGLKKTLGL